jgi:hypothetical protein
MVPFIYIICQHSLPQFHPAATMYFSMKGMTVNETTSDFPQSKLNDTERADSKFTNH